jgi:hypothetical protein
MVCSISAAFGEFGGTEMKLLVVLFNRCYFFSNVFSSLLAEIIPL